MEPPRLGDPEWIGPYRVLARLDARLSDVPAAEHRFIARSADGDRTVLIGTPLEGTDESRAAVEAEGARRLSAPWLAVVDEVAPPGGQVWRAGPYVPAVPLPAALAAHGGPLPERTAVALGAALAETLVVLHQAGITHAGISPAAVLLAADGPRLTGFGAARAAAPDGQPQPPGDVHALGTVLAYAVTGHVTPKQSELPERFRHLISSCIASNPDNRQQMTQVLDGLLSTATAPGAGGAFGPAPHPYAPPAAVLSGGRAAALLGPGWLPPRPIAALARQSSELLAAESGTG